MRQYISKICNFLARNRNIHYVCLASLFWLLFSTYVNAYANCNVNCSICSDCETKLNWTNVTVVCLNSSIQNHSGACINDPANFNNKIFDCQKHTIDGNGTGDGIYLNNKSGNRIQNCVITGFYFGIFLSNSSNNTLTNNTVSSKGNGIYLGWSSNNIINNNTAYSNNYSGIYLDLLCSNNTIANNTIYSNNNSGIYLDNSTNNNIINNTAYSNALNGIYLGFFSNNDTLINNIAYSNNNSGIYLSWSSNNTIQENKISNNTIGIYSQNSNSTINSNVVCNNINLDFNSSDWLSSSGDNNTCDNPDGWNDTNKERCLNSCQLPVKANITAYQKTACSKYPIPQNSIYENAIVVFNASNSCGTIVSYLWDFGDGNQTSGAVLNHSYATCGNYTVNLTVTDNNGLNDSIAITVEVDIPGDINPNNAVDFWDLVDFAASWGNSCVDGNYIPKADISCDGTVNFWDLADFAANWGRSY